jgi:hypothetical protein
MSTRTIPFTQEELSIISQWATRAFQEANTAELLARIDSPQQKAAKADMEMITTIKDKLRP